MSTSLTPAAATREEDPILNLSRVAVTLHALEKLPQRANSDEGVYPDCPNFRNMELDLLAYGFQARPPFGSCCEGGGPIPLTIRFPESFAYHSEGSTVTLRCSRPNRKASLLLSSTTFPASGIRVWHLTFIPAEGDAFSEFDIIKLIQIYDGRIENSGLDKLIRFQHEKGDGAARTLAELIPVVCGAGVKAAEVRAGTVDIVVGTSPEHTRMIEVVRGAREPGGTKANEQLAEWMRDGASEVRILNAFCGIITGIFDFDMERGELLDTLEPTFAEGDTLLRLMRRTLVRIADADRTLEKCWETIGNSPYLLIPHAVLLHNEAVVDEAEKLMDAAARQSRNVRQLENIRREAELNLNRLHLPNVFNYVQERTLLERGAAQRGADDRRRLALAKLSQLDSLIESRWERRREQGQMAIGVLLALLSVLQVRDVVFDALGDGFPEIVKWGALGGLACLLAILIIGFSRLGLRG